MFMMFRTVTAPIMFAAGAWLLAGCATIVGGTTQQVSFQSSPEGVLVTLVRETRINSFPPENGKTAQYDVKEETRILGRTPLTLQLDRVDDDQSVVFSREGYKPLTMNLTTRLTGLFWGNIVFGGLLGSTTDSLSGAAYEYTQNQFFVTLNPDVATPIEHAMARPQRDKALVFIVLRYQSLMANISEGAGEDWSALMGLLHIGHGDESDARKKIQALAVVYPDAGVFATQLTDLYLKR